MSRVLITGSTGLLGCSLAPFLQERGYQVIRMGNSHASDLNFDLTCYDQTRRFLDNSKPDIIINLVALTNVDRCETHLQDAYLLNVKTVENLSGWLKRTGQSCHLIHISTDQLYDGLGPHAEEELTIRNFYAMSKLAGELIAEKVPSTILRSNFVGRSLCEGRTSLTDWLFAALLDKSSVELFDDVMFSPLAIRTLCECIESCIVNKPLGIFNLGSQDGMSKADFAFAFAAALGLGSENFKRVSAKSIPRLIASRPSDMRMDCRRYEERMGIRLPYLQDEIYLMAKDYL